MYKIIFLSEAFDDIEQAGKWYAEQKKLLDIDFIEETFSRMDGLQSDSVLYKKHIED